jgi:hypothetical protein
MVCERQAVTAAGRTLSRYSSSSWSKRYQEGRLTTRALTPSATSSS